MNRTGHWSAVLLGGLCLVGSAALPASAAPQAPGVALQNAATQTCLHQVGDTDVELAPCRNGADESKWQLTDAPNGTKVIKNAADGRCLGHAGREDVKIYSCAPNEPGQQWRTPASGSGQQLRSVANGECLGHIQGAEVGLLKQCRDEPAQQWTTRSSPSSSPSEADDLADLDF